MKRLLYILSILLCLASCKEDEVIISQHGTTYDTVRVNVRQNLYDTVRKLIYDTTRTKVYDTVHATVNDTVWNHQTITSYDTIRTLISDTITIKNYDTVRIVNTITNYDTVRTVIKDTIITKINDTIWSHQTINDTVWDYQTVVKYDTVRTKVNDTVWSYETVVRYDTVKVDIYDTVKVTIMPDGTYNYYKSTDLNSYLQGLRADRGDVYITITDEKPDFVAMSQAISSQYQYFDVYLNMEHCTGITEIPDFAFKDCRQLEGIILPKTITRIGVCAFYECSIGSINLTENITEIDERAFYKCYNLDIDLPKSLQSIGIAAFYMSNLSSVVFPDGITEIKREMFRECGKITSATIPVSVKKIDDYAFCGCSNLISLTFYCTIPPELGTAALDYMWKPSKTYKMYVPKAAVETYKNADGWSRYAQYIEGF